MVVAGGAECGLDAAGEVTDELGELGDGVQSAVFAPAGDYGLIPDMPARSSAIVPTRVEHSFDVDAELARVFGDGVRPLHFEQALVDAMLAGWARQQQSRMLCRETIVNRRRLVGRLLAHADAWPWELRAEHLEEWIEDLALAPRRLHASTLRNYQIATRLFCDYLLDRRYPWTAICTERLGATPRQIVDERNLIVHTNEFEGDPSRRPLSRDELVAFSISATRRSLAAARCDARDRSRRSGTRRCSRRSTRGAAPPGGGQVGCLRLARNPHKPDFGAFGSMSVRYGKAMAGGPPRRRDVLTVFDWAVEVRPVHGGDPPGLRPRRAPGAVAERRGGRISSPYISDRFAHYRDQLGLPRELTPHGLRHSYVTHLIEDGFDPLFVQLQIGHRHASTTAIYTAVNGDFKQRALADALRAQLETAGA